MTDEFAEMLDPRPAHPRFVIFSSYGNDSVALIQWASEQQLTDVAVVYTDTKWSASWWGDRVASLEQWVRGLGFAPYRTQSIGFRELAFRKKAFPTQQYQWCSYILKIEPGQRWLEENDPQKWAICLVGVRREESQDRSQFPIVNIASAGHGGRVTIAPMAEWSEDVRNDFLKRAGVEPLPHRSMECSPCINSNKEDLKALTEAEIVRSEDLENDLNNRFGPTRNNKRRTLFRPHRHMGAIGVREVVRWAHSERGKYRAPEPFDEFEAMLDPDLDEGAAGCEAGFCPL